MKNGNKYILVGASVVVASFVFFYISRGKTSSRFENKGY
jgi:hypothetical protein|tara:strand:- start:1081 stop:1197 length:117 start_codon:yes stop_codon:yes gene_type:complete